MQCVNIRVLNHRESYGTCQLCGKKAELRPYGPNREWVCFECGMKDEATTAAQFANLFDRADVTVIDAR
jgi:hypothetical protein